MTGPRTWESVTVARPGHVSYALQDDTGIDG
jgi:hypothetical protein